MSELPTVNGKQVVAALRRAGFLLEKVNGSHHILRDPVSGTHVSVPVHGTRDMKAGTVRGVIRDAGLTVTEFAKLVK